MRGVRINSNDSATDSLRIEVFQVRVQKSFRATRTKTLDNVGHMNHHEESVFIRAYPRLILSYNFPIFAICASYEALATTLRFASAARRPASERSCKSLINPAPTGPEYLWS